MRTLYFSCLLMLATLSTLAQEKKCIYGDCVNGWGAYAPQNGIELSGYFSEGMLWGYGKKVYPNGSTYYGGLNGKGQEQDWGIVRYADNPRKFTIQHLKGNSRVPDLILDFFGGFKIFTLVDGEKVQRDSKNGCIIGDCLGSDFKVFYKQVDKEVQFIFGTEEDDYDNTILHIINGKGVYISNQLMSSSPRKFTHALMTNGDIYIGEINDELQADGLGVLLSDGRIKVRGNFEKDKIPRDWIEYVPGDISLATSDLMLYPEDMSVNPFLKLEKEGKFNTFNADFKKALDQILTAAPLKFEPLKAELKPGSTSGSLSKLSLPGIAKSQIEENFGSGQIYRMTLEGQYSYTSLLYLSYYIKDKVQEMYPHWSFRVEKDEEGNLDSFHFNECENFNGRGIIITGPIEYQLKMNNLSTQQILIKTGDGICDETLLADAAGDLSPIDPTAYRKLMTEKHTSIIQKVFQSFDEKNARETLTGDCRTGTYGTTCDSNTKLEDGLGSKIDTYERRPFSWETQLYKINIRGDYPETPIEAKAVVLHFAKLLEAMLPELAGFDKTENLSLVTEGYDAVEPSIQYSSKSKNIKIEINTKFDDRRIDFYSAKLKIGYLK